MSEHETPTNQPIGNPEVSTRGAEKTSPLEPQRRCQCEHVNCHPEGNCQLLAVRVETHFGMRQALCQNCMTTGGAR